MNELQFASRIRQVLGRGRLEALQLERLRAARERALARQKAEPAPALAWADNALGRFGGFGGFSMRLLLPTAALLAGLVAIYGWEQNRIVAELEEIDALLLSDDLPIDAYLDKGFEAWLKKQRAQR